MHLCICAIASRRRPYLFRRICVQPPKHRATTYQRARRRASAVVAKMPRRGFWHDIHTTPNRGGCDRRYQKTRSKKFALRRFHGFRSAICWQMPPPVRGFCSNRFCGRAVPAANRLDSWLWRFWLCPAAAFCDYSVFGGKYYLRAGVKIGRWLSVILLALFWRAVGGGEWAAAIRGCWHLDNLRWHLLQCGGCRRKLAPLLLMPIATLRNIKNSVARLSAMRLLKTQTAAMIIKY